MDTETVIFSTGATCRVAERILTEGITVADDVVGAVVFVFLVLGDALSSSLRGIVV